MEYLIFTIIICGTAYVLTRKKVNAFFNEFKIGNPKHRSMYGYHHLDQSSTSADGSTLTLNEKAAYLWQCMREIGSTAKKNYYEATGYKLKKHDLFMFLLMKKEHNCIAQPDSHNIEHARWRKNMFAKTTAPTHVVPDTHADMEQWRAYINNVLTPDQEKLRAGRQKTAAASVIARGIKLYTWPPERTTIGVVYDTYDTPTATPAGMPAEGHTVQTPERSSIS